MAEIIKRHGKLLISVSDGWGHELHELLTKKQTEQLIKDLTEAKEEIWQKPTT